MSSARLMEQSTGCKETAKDKVKRLLLKDALIGNKLE